MLLCAGVAAAQRLDELAVEIRRGRREYTDDLEAAQPQRQRRQQADRAGTDDAGPRGGPEAEPTLDGVGLAMPFCETLAGSVRTPTRSSSAGTVNEELLVVDKPLCEEAVEQIDAPLAYDVVGGEVLAPDAVVEAGTRSADGRDDEVAERDRADGWPDGLDAADVLVAEDEVVVARRCRAEVCLDDLAIRAVDADLEDARTSTPRPSGTSSRLGAGMRRACSEWATPAQPQAPRWCPRVGDYGAS